MANLVVDIGNTFTKLGVFEQYTLLHTAQFENQGAEALTEVLSRYAVKSIIISSVKTMLPDWLDMLDDAITPVFFNATMAPGITNHYTTPQTLGPDRVAAIAGAWQLYPKQSSLVIDGGTTITYDWVDTGGNYFGGSISPGLNMRYKALKHYTAGLPLIAASVNFNQPYGNSTTTAIQSGVQNGLKYELTGFIESYRQHDEKLNVILTGGNSIFFDTLLKNSIFAPYIKIEPHLVLTGLNAALQQHND